MTRRATKCRRPVRSASTSRIGAILRNGDHNQVKDTYMNRLSILRLIAAGCLGLSAACTLSDQGAPALTGPSELGLSLALTATPDLVAANGSSQSIIEVIARDPNGQPSPNVEMRIDTVNSAGFIDE